VAQPTWTRWLGDWRDNGGTRVEVTSYNEKYEMPDEDDDDDGKEFAKESLPNFG
jgi:hypothetical protein